MEQSLYDVKQIADLIIKGKKLLLSGDRSLLAQLPSGDWIAGTIPYFIAENGGTITKEKIFASILPDYVKSIDIKVYDENSISKVYDDASENGFSVIIIPATSGIHLKFAIEAPKFSNFATRPLAGWISGVHLSDLGTVTPEVFSGKSKDAMTNSAVVMHITLPAGKYADLNILNIFKQGSGDSIKFTADGFKAVKAVINGKEVSFAKYLKDNAIDTRLPLVADYFGAMVNVSFQGVDEAADSVSFYAPVFKDIEYRIAGSIQNYVKDFTSALPTGGTDTILFSCNCILNFLYSELEGKKTGNIQGPITFGEIAYQLLNQTMVSVSVHDL